MVECVYCGHAQNDEFNDEHVMPRAMGKFLLDGHELIINDRVCNDCNRAFSWCEGELAYSGLEAINRRKVGIKGRNPERVKQNPFYKNRFSRQPIKMTGVREGEAVPSRWEVDSKTGLAVELNQIRFIHPDTNEPVIIPIEAKMTRDSLLENMKQQGWVEKHPFEIFCSEEIKSWIAEIFKKDSDKIEWRDQRELTTTGNVHIESKMLITDKHHRAVAKIAFSYLMYFKPCGITGHEDVFAELRAFIRYGKGSPGRFVRYVDKNVLYETGDCCGLVDYGHIVTCDIGKNGVESQVQLFTGREHAHGSYRVGLGKYPFRVQCEDRFGHWFRITSTRESKEDSGEIIPLVAPRRIVPPSPYYLNRNLIKRIKIR